MENLSFVLLITCILIVKAELVDPPVVEVTISPEDVKEGNSVSLFCSLVDGDPQNLFRVRWFRGEKLLRETTEREIVWVSVTRNSSGIYSCEGENAAGWGKRSKEKELIVKYLPGPAKLIEMNPPAIKGKTSFLHCDVDELGLPPANIYRWEKDGELLATTSSENYTTETLRVTSRGNYSCAAVNEGVGVGPKGYAFISVFAPPTFIQDLPDITRAARDSPFINLECKVECKPQCYIRWMRNRDRILNSELYIVRNLLIEEGVMINNTFRIAVSNLRFNMTAWPGRRLDKDRDTANYTCYTKGNYVGEGVSSTTLFLVDYKPECTITESTNEEGEHILICSADGFSEKINFTWSKDNETLDDNFDMVSNHDNYSTYILLNSAERYGMYTCIATNDAGESEPCEKMVIGADSFKLIRQRRDIEDIESSFDQIAAVPIDTSPLPERCTQPPDSGMCLAYFLNYYYNSAQGRCETFVYGGCGGNDNNFWNQQDCETVCGGGAGNGEGEEDEFNLIMESLQPLVERKDDCEYPPETGECRAAFQHYYFNGEKCEEFIYGGCGGNLNNFPTEEECIERCMQKSENETEENGI